jgi:hypothetical protein
MVAQTGVLHMPSRLVIETQLEFYRKGGAGCLFAAHAAQNPKKFGWRLSVTETEIAKIVAIANGALSDEAISTQSIIMPSVVSSSDLVELLRNLEHAEPFSLGLSERFKRVTCLGLRVRVGTEDSWVAGFGNYKFLPKTRQAVFTELTFRTKKRPVFDMVMKEAPPDTLHVADMDLLGINENKFKALWYGSFDKTEAVLGHKPDLQSAAKTTFVIPTGLWEKSKRAV